MSSSSSPQSVAKLAWFRLIGRVRHAKAGQKRLRSYANVEVRMTKEEFLAWAIPKYEAWFQDHPGVKPSVDRIRSEGHYEVSNLQIIAHVSNCGKTSRAVNIHLPDGHKQCGRCKQPLPFSSFKKVKPGMAGTFGLQGWCIECYRAYDRERAKTRVRT